MNTNLLKNKTFLAAVLGAVLGALGGVAGSDPTVIPPGAMCPCSGVVMVPPVACPPVVDAPCDATAGKAD